ncbi:MAG: hypothetical protein JO215_13445, partial [Ktedonobacteraceae bacterium]|nr:hypothetical protein [Ktedonobacteraceae bacterium]
RYRGNSILVTSRPVGYELFGFSKRWFTHATVQELDDEQIHQFLELWYNRVLQLAPLPYEDQKELASLYETLKSNPRLHTLARNPLLLTIITTLHRTERLPDRRVHVYDRCADLLLDTWSRRRGTNERWQDMQMTRDIQRASLAHLGFVLYERLQEREKDGSGTFYGDCLTLSQMQTEVENFLKSRQLFSPEERQVEAERFLELMRTETGLIVKRGRDEGGEALYGFIHRTFQEYFAALDIYFRQADSPHPDAPGENANTILNTFLTHHLHDPYWQEVILLLFGKLGPVRATVQIQMILDPPGGKVCCRSNHTEIIQQDLFFACTCLREEITVQNNLAREILIRMSKLIQSSPFPSQRFYAIDALVSLLKTQQYSQLARTSLLDLLAQKTLADNTRIQIAQTLYRSTPLNSEAQVQAQQVLTALTQEPGASAASTIQAAQALYECYPNGSAEQLQAVQTMLDVAAHHHLSFEQTIQTMRPFLQQPSISDENVRLISHTLLQRVQQLDMTLEQARLLVDTLSYSAMKGALNDWESAADKLLALLENSSISFEELVASTFVLYQFPVQSERRLKAARHLLDSTNRPDISVEEIVEIGEALSWNDHDEADERQRVIALLTNALQRPELSFEQRLQLLETLYGSSPDGSSEQQQVIQQLLQLAQQTTSFEEKMQAAEVLYRCSPLNSQENQQSIDTLLALAQAPDLKIEETVAVFQLLDDYDLTATPEGLEALSTLARLLQKPDLSQQQQLEVARGLYDASLPRSENRQQAAQILWKQAQENTLPLEQRLQAATPPLTVRDANYPDRAQAIRIILTLQQREDARAHLEHYWQPVSVSNNRAEPSDIPALIELVQQELLPLEVRDEIYRILRQLVPQFGTTPEQV